MQLIVRSNNSINFNILKGDVKCEALSIFLP